MASVFDSLLQPGERVVYRGINDLRVWSPYRLTGFAAFMILMVIFGSVVPDLFVILVIVAACVGFGEISTIVGRARSIAEIAVTDRRILYSYGIDRGVVGEIALADIESLREISGMSLSRHSSALRSEYFKVKLRVGTAVRIQGLFAQDEFLEALPNSIPVERMDVADIHQSNQEAAQFLFMLLLAPLSLGLSIVLLILLPSGVTFGEVLDALLLVALFLIPLAVGGFAAMVLGTLYILRSRRKLMTLDEARRLVMRMRDPSSRSLFQRLICLPLPVYERSLTRIYGQPAHLNDY